MLPRCPVRGDRGQAAVELCALMPVLGVLALALWQLAVCGHGVWATGAAARAAARAVAVGGDAEAAARGVLPARLEERLQVREGDEGEATVRVRVPLVTGGGALLTLGETARFAPQEG